MTQSGLRLGRTALLITVASGVIGMLKKLPISVARSKKIAVLEPTSRAISIRYLKWLRTSWRPVRR
jgi:hypothetical protein